MLGFFFALLTLWVRDGTETGESRPRSATELDACASTEDADLRTPVYPARRAVYPGEEPNAVVLRGD